MKSCFLPEVMKLIHMSIFWVLSRETWFYLLWPQSVDLSDGSQWKQSFPALKGIKISEQFQSAMRGLLFVCTAWSEDQYESVRSGMACVGHAKNIALSPVCSTPPWGSWACGPWLCVQRRSSSGTRRSWNASDCDTYHEEIARRKSDTKANISQGINSNSQAII